MKGIGMRGVGILPLSQCAYVQGGGLFNTIMGLNPIAYWPLNELSGTTAINYGSLGTAANGTYSNVTLANTPAPGGGLAPYFNGTTAYVEAFSAALAAGINTNEITIQSWVRVNGAANWTNGTFEYVFYLKKDNSNVIWNGKSSTNNQVRAAYMGNSVNVASNATTSSTLWLLLTQTVSISGGSQNWYINDTLLDTDAVANAFVGPLVIARISGNEAIVYPFRGHLSNSVIYNKILTQPQISLAYLAGGV